MSELAAVEETAVWLEVNGRPAVTWMCTPELLEELAVGWLHGEGYIDRVDEVQLRPCATDLGFWAQVPPGESIDKMTPLTVEDFRTLSRSSRRSWSSVMVPSISILATWSTAVPPNSSP